MPRYVILLTAKFSANVVDAIPYIKNCIKEKDPNASMEFIVVPITEKD